MKKKVLWGSAAAVAVLLLARVVFGTGREAAAGYRFVEITRGDIESVVSTTGTLQATETVEVGTQVSGQIAEIHVDFNDRVEKGQLIARIDPTLLRQEVRAAEVSVERSRAELEQAKRQFERIARLYEQKVVTDSEYDAALYNYDVARAAYASAQLNLERARQNLAYTEIRAPISGVVVERSVEVGQTVAASMSAPKLFLIAKDFSEMEILATVDESDIGLIHPGQPVRFTVQAYPDTQFTGTVRQVRLQSTVQENVVSYTVVITVDNPDGRLLPGMTATVEFIVDRAEDVLLVPNSALRFRPTEEMRRALAARREQERAAGARAQAGQVADPPAANGAVDAAARPAGGPGARSAADAAARPAGEPTTRSARAGVPADGARGAAPTLLWFLDEDGKVNAVPVRTGITDGQRTAITGPPILREGMKVIAAVTTGSAPTTATNPFQSQQRSGPPRPPGLF
ncbi:MAG TPA: efflux RND transporter periplasmic adaptor subunit [Longimicrobiales bacterium]